MPPADKPLKIYFGFKKQGHIMLFNCTAVLYINTFLNLKKKKKRNPAYIPPKLDSA